MGADAIPARHDGLVHASVRLGCLTLALHALVQGEEKTQ